MAIALEVGVFDLLAELLAHTLGVGGALSAAGAVSARGLQPLLDGFDDLLVFVKCYSHRLDTVKSRSNTTMTW